MRNGKALEDPDLAWLCEQESETVAEVDADGLWLNSFDDVVHLLYQLPELDRYTMALGTIKDEVEFLSPQFAREIASTLAAASVTDQAALLTSDGELEGRIVEEETRLEERSEELMECESDDVGNGEVECEMQDSAVGNAAGDGASGRPQVRPIQAGELLRKITCKQEFAVERPDVLAVTVAMRQFGCCAPGGAETIIHFRKTIASWHRKGKLTGHLCAIDHRHRPKEFLRDLGVGQHSSDGDGRAAETWGTTVPQACEADRNTPT